MITYKFRLHPSKEQQSQLWFHANKLNWLYNYFLNQKIEAYKKDKTSLSRYDLQKQIPELKSKDPVLAEIHSQVVQQVTYRLDISYKNFFRRVKCGKKAGFPKFRSCRNFFSIIYPQSGYSIQGNIFHTKIYGDVKFNRHRDIQGNIKTVTIKCENNKWFLCITTDYEKEKLGNGIIGIDVGITNLVATSESKIIKNKTHAKYFDKKINKLKSRRDTQCKKGSRYFRFLSEVIQRLYDVKNRKINDFLHKVSKNLSSKYDTIICEDLALKKMSESEIRGLNRELRNSQLAKFISYLSYKTKTLVKINPQDTSKTCNNCGQKQDMPLHKRRYKCSCSYEEDRDVNAAKNIFCLGQAILERECSVTLQEALAFRRG